jgi:cold shock CspA family protein
MPLTGTLRSWNDDRGFGFIAPTQGGPEVFVHASAFPQDGSRPTIGEKLTYEIERGRDGKS